MPDDPRLHTRLCDLVGVRHPIVQTGMGWVSGSRLTAATAQAGGLGIIAAAPMTFDQMATAIAEVRAATDAPFGVNLGGPNPGFLAYSPDLVFDSYLTVGQEQAELSVSPGEGGQEAIDAWGVSEAAAIATEDGAIFYMDPDSGPASDGAMIFAQLTLADATVAAGGTAGANLQGRSVEGEDWEGFAVAWAW